MAGSEQMAHLAAVEREGIETSAPLKEREWTDADEEEYQREEEVRRVQWEMNQH